jgi:hypothetical protein
MIELIIFTIIFLIIVKGIPLIRQIDDEYTEKYNKKNKWKENITQCFNGHHQNIGYQDYKYDEEYIAQRRVILGSVLG